MKHDDARVLFSDAFDRELDPAQQRSFDTHLQECEACGKEFAEYTRTLRAVHAMPVVTMPVAVTIPDIRATPLQRFASSLLRGRGLATLTGLAAAAAILLVSTQFHGSVPAPGSSALRVQTPGFAARPSGPLAADMAAGCTPAVLPKDSVPVSSAGSSANAANGGSRLHVYTDASTVSAGETITVYAAASITVASVGAPGSTPPVPEIVAPCVSMSVGGASAASAGPQVQAVQPDENAVASGAQKSAPGQSVMWKVVDDGSSTTLTIPASAPSGSLITVVAEVPAGAGGIATAPAMEATLTLRVR